MCNEIPTAGQRRTGNVGQADCRGQEELGQLDAREQQWDLLILLDENETTATIFEPNLLNTVQDDGHWPGPLLR